MIRPADHPPIEPPRVGVLLSNLGTPDAPTPGAVRRYLAEFLSDRRVVEIPPLLWKPILHGIVLRTRPRRSAAAYQEVWTDEGSPLAAITRAQALALQARLGDGVMVHHAMRYGAPAIGAEIAAMQAAGCRRILLAPLYPQYCGATTASANDAAFAALAGMRWQPALRTLPPYFDDAAYIDALARSVDASLAAIDFVPEMLLTSFHGMPRRTLDLGDPYHCQCQTSARLLAERLGERPFGHAVSFQSRFGRAEWLGPATDAEIDRLAGMGVRRLAVLAPGFSADCLETLEELAIRGRDRFLAAGGTHFAYLPCLNSSDDGMAMVETLVRRELAGWV